MTQYASGDIKCPSRQRNRHENDDVARGSRSKTDQEGPQEGARADGGRHSESGGPAAKTLLTDGGVADETVREVHTSEGCKVSVKSKRGTGTRDQDEIKVELSDTDPHNCEAVAKRAAEAAELAMAERRGDQDGESA